MKSAMFKTVMMGVAGAAMLAMVGTAGAAERNINIYGASAQHLFWKTMAPTYLTTAGAAGGAGCTSYTQVTFDSKQHITKGVSCAAFGGDDINIRVSSKASYDGIRAMKGVDDPDSCGSNYQRKMVDSITNNALVCKDVTIGASDVAGESFVQSSAGALKGPLGGVWTERSFSGIDTTGLTSYNPLVVPFGFFVNNSVKVRYCSAPTSMKGEQCMTNANCDSSPGAGDGVCADPIVLDDISRHQAVQVFSGNVYYWPDFGGGFFPPDGSGGAELYYMPVVACLRHAGSGTHATLDFAVMRGNGWGGTLAGEESTSEPIVYFNDGSSDMMKCVNGSGEWTGEGAIGYADADQSLSTYTDTTALKYNGRKASRINIRNGVYDNFWSTQWLYEDPAEPNYALTHGVVTSMVDFASDPGNITYATLGVKANYWATMKEMVWMKSSDAGYPTYIGATEQMYP